MLEAAARLGSIRVTSHRWRDALVMSYPRLGPLMLLDAPG